MFPVLGSAQQITYATNVGSLLAQIYLWDPAWALSQDPEIYEKQQRDLVISGSLDVLQRAIVGHRFSFTPKKDDERGRLLAKVVEDLTKEQRGFRQSLYNLARASHRGSSWGRIYPERRVLDVGDGKPREWTVVARVRDADKRRFRLVQDLGAGTALAVPSNISPASAPAAGGEKVTREGADLGVLGRFKWQFHAGFIGRAGSQYYTDLPLVAPFDHWIQHVPDTSEWGFAYGYGLADELQAFFWLKGSFLRWAAQSAERYGQGFLKIISKALREGMAVGANQAARLQQTVQIVRTFRSENFIALDENSDAALLDMPGEGMRWLFEWVRYLDDGMRQRILAALQPTGSKQGGTGSFSSAKVEEGSQDDQVAYLRSPLEETWTQTVVRFLVEHNRDNLAELGLDGIGLPGLQLRGREQRDIELYLKVFEFAWKAKIPIREQDFYEITKLSPPNEAAQAIAWPEPVADLGRDDVTKDFEDEREPVGSGGGAVGESRSASRLNGKAA